MTGLCAHCRQPARLVGPCHFACPGWLCQTCFDAMITLAELAQTSERWRLRDATGHAMPDALWTVVLILAILVLLRYLGAI